MYKAKKATKSSIVVNKSYPGETLEDKIDRIVNGKEAIKDGSPQIYTERKDGVLPQYDIRTDRFDIALDAMTKVDASYKAQREKSIGERTYDTMTGEQQKEFTKKFPNAKIDPGKTKGNEGGA